MLLEAGADVTKSPGGLTALQHAAAENNNPEVFSAAFLEAGSDVNAKFEGGTTPLHSVVSFNPSVEIVQLLMYGADVHEMDQQFGITPLHAASAFGTNPEVISVLLYAGANPNLCNKKGQLPLDMARDNDALQGTEALDELTEQQANKFTPPETSTEQPASLSLPTPEKRALNHALSQIPPQTTPRKSPPETGRLPKARRTRFELATSG